MRKTIITLLTAVCLTTATAQSPNTPASQMEKLTRGVVALKNWKGDGNFISWRLLGTDDHATTAFNLYRDGILIAENMQGGTCYTDEQGTTDSRYSVVTLVNGSITETSTDAIPWNDTFKQLKLQMPDASVNNNDSKYYPNDISVGDVDGDGEYELIVKWDPCGTLPSQDNSKTGKTGNVVIDCYKLDGTRLWSINLGPNIRAGAHYTQFLVYDFDGDGKAEMICRTAPWSKDGLGKYVSAAADEDEIKNASNTTSYRDGNGRVNSGPEYLTVFNGETGAAIHTIFYNPNRAGELGGAPSHPTKSFWGDNYGGRADRYLATVAYLGGPDQLPSAIMVRGYYTRSYFWAVDFDGYKLKTRWLHASVDANTVELTDANGNKTTRKYTSNTAGISSSNTAYGNGNHNLSCADVDGDGCDEIIMGSCAIDNDGSLLYATGFGHGDAIHLGDLNPARPGLEVFQVHEEKHGTSTYGWDLHDARTGEILFSANGSADNGRGMAGDIVADNDGYEFWSSNDRQPRSAVTGEVATTKSVSVNFRMYWTGDLQDELLDGTSLNKLINNSNTNIVNFANYNNSQSCNSTKKNPNLVADLFGDWREEVIFWSGDDNCTLNIFTTTEPTDYRVPTLMHDHTYRMAISWQQSAYNQPPHLGYYLPYYAPIFTPTGIESVTVTDQKDGNKAVYDLTGRKVADNIDDNQLKGGLYITKGKKILIKQ
ncbi:MAG: rhamnogalacturonan lyase [Prevotella sp.]|nr:rhamnogalacturonan lyase [Prevotella sp.]